MLERFKYYFPFQVIKDNKTGQRYYGNKSLAELLNEQHETIQRLKQNINELSSVDIEEELLKKNEQLKKRNKKRLRRLKNQRKQLKKQQEAIWGYKGDIKQLKKENEQLKQEEKRLYNYFRKCFDNVSEQGFHETWEVVKQYD